MPAPRFERPISPRPTRRNSICQRCPPHAQQPRKRGKMVFTPVIQNADVVAQIALLFSGCGPPTVPRFVTPGPVNAVNRGAYGALSHVGEKLREVVPPLANGNSARSVSGEFVMVGVLAPLPHRMPRLISWRVPASSMAVLAMRARRGRNRFSHDATPISVVVRAARCSSTVAARRFPSRITLCSQGSVS